MSAAEIEGVQLDAGGTDAVTLSFATPDASVCGLVRLGLGRAEKGGPVAGSALAVLFAEGVPHALLAEGGLDVQAPEWESVVLAGVEHRVLAPLERWSLTGRGLELAIEATGSAVGLEEPVGGLGGYEQLVRVTGRVTLPGGERRVDALGQRGHGWGAPDWSKLHSVRTVSMWLGEDGGATLTAARRSKAKGHEKDEVWGAMWDAAGAHPVDDPRLSTTYDADGHQRRAGLELWLADPDDEDFVFPRRAAGRALCGSSLELGSLRLDCAFFAWTAGGASGVGRYDLLRHA